MLFTAGKIQQRGLGKFVESIGMVLFCETISELQQVYPYSHSYMCTVEPLYSGHHWEPNNSEVSLTKGLPVYFW